jgi:hypothetical protein
MTRRVLLLLLVVAVLLVGGAAALVLTSRPALSDRREAVDTRWAALRTPLATRYDTLAQLAEALSAAGAGERTYTVDLAGGIGTWRDLTGNADADPAAEALAANRLEGLAARTRVNVAGSVRLSRDAGIAAALAAFDAALVPPDEVGRYNRAVRRYQSTRNDTLKQVSADLLGYETRPVLVVGAPPTG